MIAAEVTKLKPAPELPKPDPRSLVPHPEDWAAWCQNPITRFVATAMMKAAEQQREAWLHRSWSSGEADPAALNQMRAYADAYMAFLETPLERYAKIIEA